MQITSAQKCIFMVEKLARMCNPRVCVGVFFWAGSFGRDVCFLAAGGNVESKGLDVILPMRTGCVCVCVVCMCVCVCVCVCCTRVRSLSLVCADREKGTDRPARNDK